jgi:hypothetical protein
LPGIRIFKIKGVRLVGTVAGMGAKNGAYKVFVGKLEGKILLRIT